MIYLNEPLKTPSGWKKDVLTPSSSRPVQCCELGERLPAGQSPSSSHTPAAIANYQPVWNFCKAVLLWIEGQQLNCSLDTQPAILPLHINSIIYNVLGDTWLISYVSLLIKAFISLQGIAVFLLIESLFGAPQNKDIEGLKNVQRR